MIRFNSSSFSLLLFFLWGFALSGCKETAPPSDSLYQAVDELYEQVSGHVSADSVIAQIDHSRLAAEAGEVMPPARVLLWSDAEINSAILQEQPQAGLDLPFRVLAYADGDKSKLVYTNADFIGKRHGLTSGPALGAYEQAIDAGVGVVASDSIQTMDSSTLEEGEGIVRLQSDYDFDETIERLRTDILAEGDTLWFGEIDYQADAAKLDIELPRLTLLLFGAPGPGAKAMAEYPRMGLDAFCQKALVMESPEGEVAVLYNEIPFFAEFHHGEVGLPHRVINQRMGKTLKGAVER